MPLIGAVSRNTYELSQNLFKAANVQGNTKLLSGASSSAATAVEYGQCIMLITLTLQTP